LTASSAIIVDRNIPDQGRNSPRSRQKA
jgi:hypothetical protein